MCASAVVSHGRPRRSWALIALLAAACEPLDIPLFPVRVDAGPEQQPLDDAAQGVDPPPPDAPSEAGTQCLPGATRCQDCVAESACAADQRCHPFTGQCVTPCGPALPACPAPEVCNEQLGGVCVTCIDNSTCPEDDEGTCDELQGICVECRDDSDCTDDPRERPICLPGLNRCGCETGDDCESGVCELPEAQCEDEEEEDN